jgi:hypothetical protein
MGNSLKERQNPEPYKYRENEFTKLCFGWYKNKTITMVWTCPKSGRSQMAQRSAEMDATGKEDKKMVGSYVIQWIRIQGRKRIGRTVDEHRRIAIVNQKMPVMLRNWYIFQREILWSKMYEVYIIYFLLCIYISLWMFSNTVTLKLSMWKS